MVDRNRMLTELTAAMHRHHARRRAYRRAAASLAIVAIAACAVLIARPVVPEPRAQADPVVTVVRNTPRTGLIRTIGDDELLERLTEIARPTGMIRSEGRVWLTNPPV